MPEKQFEGLIRPHLTSVQTYQPVDPPEVLAERAGISPDSIVKLNGNENPYGPSPKAAEAVYNSDLHIYPDPFQRRLRAALSEYTGFGDENIIAGAGSDELIDLLFRLFIEPGDVILDCEPTFAMYAFCARVAGGELKLIQRDELFEIDLQAVRDAIDDTTKIIFVSSPNNPTGNMASEDQVRALLDTGLVVVVDEAYYEFSWRDGGRPDPGVRQPRRTAHDEQVGWPRWTANRLRDHGRCPCESHHRHQVTVQRKRSG